MHDRVKVDGRTNNLAGSVSIARPATPGHITVTVSPNTPFPKRYLKYLTKKFLKKHQLRDWIRVVANAKGSYELKYFNVAAPEADDDEDEE